MSDSSLYCKAYCTIFWEHILWHGFFFSNSFLYLFMLFLHQFLNWFWSLSLDTRSTDSILQELHPAVMLTFHSHFIYKTQKAADFSVAHLNKGCVTKYWTAQTKQVQSLWPHHNRSISFFFTCVYTSKQVCGGCNNSLRICKY